MDTPHSTTIVKEFEVTGVSRSGRVRKKSSKLLDFQSPDEVERKIYKRTTASTHSPKVTPTRYAGRGRPSLAVLKARQSARDEETDVAADDEEPDEYSQNKEDMDVDNPSKETADEDEEDDEMDEDDDINDVLHNTSGLTNASDSDDDGFGELVADLVGSERSNVDGTTTIPKSTFRQSLYMTEKHKLKETRLERKDKGKQRYTAYNMWAREHRKSNKFGKISEMDHQAARRLHELWSNVSNKEKSAWKRKAKMQSARVKQRERAEINQINKQSVEQINQTTANSTFINRPTTSRTRKLAEDKQKAKEELAVTTPLTKRTRNNSYRRNHTNAANDQNSNTSPLYAAANGSTNIYNNSNKPLNNVKNSLPAIEPIDAAAHLKLLGESLSIIGDRLKEHEGQIAVSGSLSVLLDSLLCSLGPLLCLTTRLPGLDKKPELKSNLATTLDNIAYVMPGL